MAFAAKSSKAQLITYANLSHKYIYKVRTVTIPDAHEYVEDAVVDLYIFTRNSKLIQKISFHAESLYGTVYKDNKNSRSYITGKNENAEVPDYDFGDLIIADLNFDGHEDIAIKHDSGGNGGPFYNFYLQGNNGRFYKNNYLTDHVGSFPHDINPENKTITTQIHANAYQEGRKTFRYNAKTKKWRLIKWVMVGG